MQFKNRIIAAAFAGATLAVVHAGAQGTPPPPAAPQPAPAPQPQPQAGQPQGDPAGGRGRGRGQATFPAQQRPPGDPVLIERGKALYSVTCTACHGADLRGGQLGGPNLLRSQVVLADQSGELILPIVHGSRADKGMPAFPIPDADVRAIAEYIHSIVATARNQGAPPESDNPPPDAIVGDAAAGRAYFGAKCASCHSPMGDLQGVGTRVPEGKALQNFWITGGGGGRGGRGGAVPPAANAKPRQVTTVTVTQASGEQVTGQLVRLDNFTVSLMTSEGTVRTFRRNGDDPKVVVNDPLAAHKALLPVLTDKDMHDVTAYLATLK